MHSVRTLPPSHDSATGSVTHLQPTDTGARVGCCHTVTIAVGIGTSRFLLLIARQLAKEMRKWDDHWSSR
jgi:hypothetical protein